MLPLWRRAPAGTDADRRGGGVRKVAPSRSTSGGHGVSCREPSPHPLIFQGSVLCARTLRLGPDSCPERPAGARFTRQNGAPRRPEGLGSLTRVVNEIGCLLYT